MPHQGLTCLLLALLAGLIVSIGLMAAVPPVSRDALVHHLAVPSLYLQLGGMYEIPSIKYSYYPMNLELLYLIPLYFGRTFSFVKKTKRMSARQAEEAIEEDCMTFEMTKPYFIQRWQE